MPTFDLLLPPLPYARWRPTRVSSNHTFAAAMSLIATWIERSRQRDALAALGADELRDIGVTRSEAARECDKPFWR